MLNKENSINGWLGRTLGRSSEMLQKSWPTLSFLYVKRVHAVLNYKNSVSFAKGETPQVLLRNYYEPEDGFVWSSSKWSEIIFAFSAEVPPRTKSSDLILDVDVFRAPPNLPHQTIKIYLNGWRIGSRDVTERTTALIPFNPIILKPVENVLTFDTPDASVPATFGVPDERRLGIQLFSLQFRPGG